MVIINKEHFTILIADEGKKIMRKNNADYYEKVYLAKNDTIGNYVEVEDPDRISDIEELNIKVEEQAVINATQDIVIDTSLLAVDEMFTLVESLISETSTFTFRKGGDKMVDFYVVMIQRGLKTIDQIPERYREEVRAILEKLEK